MKSPKQQSTSSEINYSRWNDDGPATKSERSSSYRPPNRNNNSDEDEEFSTEEDIATFQDELDQIPSEELEQAHYAQRYAPLSTIFVIVQSIILPLMMIQCGVAPLQINPMIGPYPDILNYWGAKNGVLIVDDGEYWRLVTPIFLHAGLIHLAGNVMVQLDSGNKWEREWGSFIWIIVYIGSAIGSSVLSVIVMPDQISVGSSGAIMGLFGAKFAEIVVLLCERGRTVRELAAEESRRRQACHVVFGIILVMAMSFLPFVDWAAHLGGLVAGFAIGIVAFSFAMRNKFGTVVWLGIGIGTCFALYSTFIAIMVTTETDDEMRDICEYYKQYFQDYECKCQLDEEWAENQNYAWVANYYNAFSGGGGGENDGGKE